MIAMQRETTAGTIELPLIQRKLLSVSATVAVLRGIGRIHPYQPPTSICSFVGQILSELRPRRVVNAFTEAVVMHHPVDRQVFDADGATTIDYLARFLMGEVLAPIGDTFVNVGNRQATTGSLRRSLGCLREFPLYLSKGAFITAKEARIIDSAGIRAGCKTLQTDINANGFNALVQRLLTGFARERNEPLAGSSATDTTGPDGAFYRAMEHKLDCADFGERQSIALKLKAALRVAERIVAVGTVKTWIAGLLARLESAEESLEGEVNSHRHILQHLRMNGFHHRPLKLEPWQRGCLRVVVERLLALFPGNLALLQQVVVEPAALVESLLKGAVCLPVGRRRYRKVLSNAYIVV